MHTAVLVPYTRQAALGAADERAKAQRTIMTMARQNGVYPASILPIYQARGRGEIGGFTVPAINIRCLTYDTARRVFRAAAKHDAGPFIFEIARSEIGYTDQRPAEYAAMIFAAALAEDYVGPVFLQGDHFQANAKKFAADPEAEERALRELITEAVAAGFLNVDIDSSTLVDLSQPTIMEQQRLNAEICAQFTAHVRSLESVGTRICIGGEIGEVGGTNSTAEELRAFMAGYNESLRAQGPELFGISKISVQTGTSHGGIPLPNGTIARVKLDFEVLRELSEIARTEFGLAGAVQHGASTLPDELFDRFPAAETAEIHLATGFQNMVYDHPMFPAALRREIYAWCDAMCANERKDGETNEQFHYKTRKKALGPFKEAFWGLAEPTRMAIMDELEERFALLFEKLGVAGRAELVRKYIPAGEGVKA